jgi:hypothetical protein
VFTCLPRPQVTRQRDSSDGSPRWRPRGQRCGDVRDEPILAAGWSLHPERVAVPNGPSTARSIMSCTRTRTPTSIRAGAGILDDRDRSRFRPATDLLPHDLASQASPHRLALCGPAQHLGDERSGKVMTPSRLVGVPRRVHAKVEICPASARRGGRRALEPARVWSAFGQSDQ